LDYNKQERKNHAIQFQKNKREELMAAKRLGNTNQGPPKLIAVIGLSAKIDVRDLIKQMVTEIGVSDEQWEYHQSNSPDAPIIVSAPKHKSRLAFYPTKRHLMSLLDITKVADMVLFVMDAVEVMDSYGVALLSTLMAQGLPTVMGAIVGLDQVKQKQRSDVRKSAISFFQQKFTSEPRILSIEDQSDISNLVRFLCVSHVRSFWRNQRSYMLPSGVHFTPHAQDSDGTSENSNEFGTLHLTGHIRGQAFDPNNLVHLTGIGDFQVLSVEAAVDPHDYDKRGPSAFSVALTTPSEESADSMMATASSSGSQARKSRISKMAPNQVLYPTPDLQETLISTTVPDTLNNEQTWPNEEDQLHADRLKSRKKILVPKGMNAYQARWLMYDDDEEGGEEGGDDGEESGEEDENGMDMDGAAAGVGEEQEEEEDFEEEIEEMEEIDDEETALIKKLEADAEAMKLEREKNNPMSRRRKNEDLEIDDEELEDDFDFPDEVQVPDGQLAQDVYRDYRGLQSFRTSPWDPYQNLPLDYAQIFRLPHFEATRKKVLKAAELATEVVPLGEFVTIHLKDVHRSVMDLIDPSMPLVASSLLLFENKFSVMHYAVTKSIHYEPNVKTGENLMFHVGFRRFTGSALFTEDTKGANKYKMEKMLHPDRGCIASVYAPITFPHQPVLLWKVDEHGVPALAASGTVRDADLNRIIVKRIVLTGHPMSVERRKVVVSGMFSHPSDVRYFMKAELHTKSGVRGQIREPLGTKGLFKCIFGDKITNADVVCLSLYKRVYPNWLEVPQPPRPEGTLTAAPVQHHQDQEDNGMEM
jgi:pre-rRNA-processing protein TSR1